MFNKSKVESTGQTSEVAPMPVAWEKLADFAIGLPGTLDTKRAAACGIATLFLLFFYVYPIWILRLALVGLASTAILVFRSIKKNNLDVSPQKAVSFPHFNRLWLQNFETSPIPVAWKKLADFAIGLPGTLDTKRAAACGIATLFLLFFYVYPIWILLLAIVGLASTAILVFRSIKKNNLDVSPQKAVSFPHFYFPWLSNLETSQRNKETIFFVALAVGFVLLSCVCLCIWLFS